METETIVMLAMGAAFAVLGFLLSFKQGVAEWSLKRGRAKIWVKLLGQARAVRVTRVVFGPFLMILGILILLMAFVVPPKPAIVEDTAPVSASVPDEATHGH